MTGICPGRVLLFAWLLLAPPAYGAGGAPAAGSTLSSLVDALSANGPGCAYVVSANGQILEEGAAGLANITDAVPLQPQQFFDVGSVTKSFTASIILDLERQSLLSLDDPVSTHVAGLPAWGNVVTVGDLIYMRSGIPDFLVDAIDVPGWRSDRLLGTELTTAQPVSSDQILSAIRSMAWLDFEPASAHAYSNSNYMLLRDIAESVSRAPFRDLVTQKAREIAGIDIKISEFKDGRRGSPSAVIGYDLTESGDSIPFLSDWDVLGASSLWLSVYDMAAWGHGLMAEMLEFGARSIPGIMEYPDARDGRGYAAGLMTIIIDGETIVYHPGGSEGFSSGVFLRPERDQVLAFSCNMSPDLFFATGLNSPAKEQLERHRELVFLMAWLSQDS